MIALRITPTIKGLSIACLVAFVVQKSADQFFGANLLSGLGLVPSLAVNEGYLWQLLTYSFLHADVSHLVLNLLMLVFIGSELESLWGRRRFLLFYGFCVGVAGLAYLLLQALFWGGNAPMVGASGGIYGLLLAYGLVFGDRVLLFMMLFPMKARHFIWVLAGVEFMTGVFSPGGALSSVAHLGGMLAGFVYLYGRGWWLIWQRQQAGGGSAKGRGSRPKSRHLKLVKSSEKSDPEDDENPKTWH